MNPLPAVVGVADHDGWAHLVTAAVKDGALVVIDRRRVELIDPGLPSEPYRRETLKMAPAEAEALLLKVRQSIAAHAEAAFADLARALGPDHALIAIALRTPPVLRLPATVAEVHASRSLGYSADAMLYHEAVRSAARAQGLNVRHHDSGEEVAAAAKALGLGAAETEQLLNELGRRLGAPWTDEHRAAAAAAIAQWIHFKRLSEAGPAG